MEIILAAIGTVLIVVIYLMVSAWRKRMHHLGNLDTKLRAVMDELGGLHKRMVDIQYRMHSDPLGALVMMFNAISPWQDRQLRDFVEELKRSGESRFEPFIKKLGELIIHFNGAGRHKYGWNRTEAGQLVTEENVYLGNVWGLWTKTAAYWRSGKDKPKGGWGYSGEYFATRNSYDVICDYQVKPFIESHAVRIAQLCDELMRLANEIAPIARRVA